MNYSKEEESDRTRRAVPARHCFTSHCTEEESLSYASVFHIALTIYVPTRIMQLDGSVEKTLINLTLFLVWFFFPLFLFLCPSNLLSLCSLAVICSSLFRKFLCKGIQQQYILYSAELIQFVNTNIQKSNNPSSSQMPGYLSI